MTEIVYVQLVFKNNTSSFLFNPVVESFLERRALRLGAKTRGTSTRPKRISRRKREGTGVDLPFSSRLPDAVYLHGANGQPNGAAVVSTRIGKKFKTTTSHRQREQRKRFKQRRTNLLSSSRSAFDRGTARPDSTALVLSPDAATAAARPLLTRRRCCCHCRSRTSHDCRRRVFSGRLPARSACSRPRSRGGDGFASGARARVRRRYYIHVRKYDVTGGRRRDFAGFPATAIAAHALSGGASGGWVRYPRVGSGGLCNIE